MDQLSFHNPTWYNAVTLTERLASLRAVRHSMLNVEIDVHLAERRMENWRLQPPFMTGSSFAQRLAMDGLSEEEFLYILGEPIEAVCDRLNVSLPWLEELAQAFSRPLLAQPDALKIPWCDQEVFFLDAIEPLIDQGRARLHQGILELIQTHSELPFEPDTVAEIVSANLPEHLSAMLSRTMVLELNVARLEGILTGDTTEERFQSFLNRLCQPEIVLAILQEYPVLARQLLMRIDQWITVSLEFLQRLCTDWEAIRATFSPKDEPGLLVRVEGGMGDSHRGGRSLLSATFGSGFKVVYKP